MFAALTVVFFQLTAWFLKPCRMDAEAPLVRTLLQLLILAVALWVAIEALGLRDPDPDVSHRVRNEPAEDELTLRGSAPFC
jgi:hypothetical protein